MAHVRQYLDPTAPIATDAIVTDDPKAAMDLAVALCESPRMSNLAHGLWGYHGRTASGSELTVQSLGVGGPSAAAVMTDLAGLGVARAIRIGSCIAPNDEIPPFSPVVVTSFEAGDGAGMAIAGSSALEPDAGLTAGILSALPDAARVSARSVDVVDPATAEQSGAAVLDLSSAAFAAVAARDGVACACALLVVPHDAERDSVDEALLGLGRRGALALSALAQTPGS